MSFSDEDLKRLKKHPDYLECRCISPEKHERAGGNYPKLKSLLHRLKCAEAVVNYQCTCEMNMGDNLDCRCSVLREAHSKSKGEAGR